MYIVLICPSSPLTANGKIFIYSNIPTTNHSAEGVTAGPSLGPGNRLLREVRSLPAGGEVILDLVIGEVIC